MTKEEMFKQLMRSEGYAKGFEDGYASCMKWMLSEKEKEEKKENGNKSDNDRTS